VLLKISDYVKFSEWIHVWWLMICLCMWIKWLVVVDIEFICQKNHVYEYVVFLWKMMNNEVVVGWTWNEFMNNCVDDELVWWIWNWWIDDESCCWCWIILKVWWNFELRQNDVWFMRFEHSCVCVYVHDL